MVGIEERPLGYDQKGRAPLVATPGFSKPSQAFGEGGVHCYRTYRPLPVAESPDEGKHKEQKGQCFAFHGDFHHGGSPPFGDPAASSNYKCSSRTYRRLSKCDGRSAFPFDVFRLTRNSSGAASFSTSPAVKKYAQPGSVAPGSFQPQYLSPRSSVAETCRVEQPKDRRLSTGDGTFGCYTAKHSHSYFLC